jgi:DNA polymerase-4
MSIRWLFIDMNSFFASVEQQENPQLRGKPVAVVPMLADSTSAIAASYEAKAFGVKTGTRVADARKMCPGIIFVEASHDRYVKYHHKILEAVETCVPIAAVMSIDEMICELKGSQLEIENAKTLAMKIKRTLAEKVGEFVKCSVGIAPNRFLAKIASDMNKPDGLTVLTKADLPHKLHSLKLRDFTGIGSQMEKRFRSAGVYQTDVLCSLSKEMLRQIWGGVLGEHFYEWLRGNDTDQTTGRTKSISHSHVLPPDLRNIEGAYLVAQKLLHKAAFRLRKANLWASSLALHVSYEGDRESFENSTRLMECQDNFNLLEALQDLWRPLSEAKKSEERERPLKVAVWLNNLVSDEEHNLSFFGNDRGLQVSQSLDEINAKFGKGSVYFGGVAADKTAAPNRIAFTSIPDLEAD